ncbi:MAG: hypothetical protein QM723_10015 [Myxococcaceae bacterium]
MGIESVGSPSFRNLESTSLNSGGKIDAAEAKKLGEAAKKEDASVAKQVLYADAFENTDARAAYAKAAGIDMKSIPANPIAGQTVGSATVERTLGNPKGYENELQAVAAARQTGVNNAAVVKQGDRYYPVQLNKSQPGPIAGNGNITKALGLTDYNQGTVDDLRTKLKAARDGGDAKGAEDLEKQLAAAVYGLPKESFNIIGRTENRVETRTDGPIPTGINIQNGLWEAGGALGTHGAPGAKTEDFNPAAGTSVTIDAGELIGRKRHGIEGTGANARPTVTPEMPTKEAAASVLEHEATHLEDFEEAKRFTSAFKKDFGPGDVDAFKAKMKSDLANHKIDSATYERVTHTVDHLNNETEAHAFVATATDSIRNGAPDAAKAQLVDFAKAQKGAPALPHAMDKVLGDATAAYKTMSKDQKAQFKAAIKAANDAVGSQSPLWGYDPDKWKPSAK